MKTRILIVLFFVTSFLTNILNAKILNPMSTSPNGKYAIEIAETQQQGFVYQVVTLEPRQTLLMFASSYQVSGDHNREWALQHTEAVAIHWSSDSRLVAIDEEKVHYQGTVFAGLIESESKAIELPVPVKEIVKSSGERWNKYRVERRRCTSGRFERNSV